MYMYNKRVYIIYIYTYIYIDITYASCRHTSSRRQALNFSSKAACAPSSVAWPVSRHPRKDLTALFTTSAASSSLDTASA